MSRMLKVKKKMASMATNTASGRATIVKFLGADGFQVVEAFKSAAATVSDEKTAKRLITDLIKLVAKVGVLVQSNKILPSDAEPAKQPITDAVNDMLDLLEQPPGGLPHAELCAGIATVAGTLCPLLEGHTKDSNLAKLRDVFEYFGSATFIAPFLNDAALAPERAQALQGLRNMVRPYETEDSAKLHATRRRNLERKRAMAADPKLRDFLDHAEGGQAAFQEFLTSGEGSGNGTRVNTLQLWLAVEDYKKIVSRPLLKARAPKVADKYLGAGASHPAGISAAVTDAVSDALFADGPGRKDIFQAAQTEALVLLAEAFDAGFVASPQFVAFAGKAAAAGQTASQRRRRSSFPNTTIQAAVAAHQAEELAAAADCGGGGGAAAAPLPPPAEGGESDDDLVELTDDEDGAPGADETKSS